LVMGFPFASFISKVILISLPATSCSGSQFKAIW
jgi:hypothetical protein